MLFQERIYLTYYSKEYKNLLNNLTETRAKDLGLELFTVENRNNLSGKKSSIESLGSCSPYEYSDACGGVKDRGVFTISLAEAVNI